MPTEKANTGKERSLLASGAIVSVLTLLSRVLGLLRDMLFAFVYGATGFDVFVVAFKVPNFFRRLFGEGAFTQAFVPILSDYQSLPIKDVKALVSYVAGSLIVVLVILLILGVLFASEVSLVFAPGFYDAPDKLVTTSELLQLTFPYILFISLTAFAASILNSYQRFAMPAFTPIVLNLCLILGAGISYYYFDGNIHLLAYGVLVAGLLQLLILLPSLHKLHLLVWPRLDFNHPGVKQIMLLMLPALFSVSVGQLNVLLDTVLASFLESGSIAWLFFADRLANFPMGVFAVAVATVILPSLSRRHSENDMDAFNATLDWGLRTVLLIGIPASLGLLLMSGPLVASIYYHYSGEFTQYDVMSTTIALQAYAVGVLAFMLTKVLVPGYFARKDMKAPVKYGVVAMVANMILNLLLWGPLAHVGLALATSLSAYLNAGLLLYGLFRSGIYRPLSNWTGFLVKLILANATMVLSLIWSVPSLEQWLLWGFWSKMAWLLFYCIVGAGVYFLTCICLGLSWKDFLFKEKNVSALDK